MKTYSYMISDEDAGSRLDSYLAQKPELPSRSRLQHLIEDLYVSVGKAPGKSSYRLRTGDEITVEVPEPKVLTAAPEKMDLDIVYEDEDLLVVNKPKGMAVHPSAGHESHTLVNGLLYHCGDSLSGVGGVLRPGIVHRIDMDTTGLLLVCKNDLSHQAISGQLKDHTITRKYSAIVHGNITSDGTVDAPIGRNPSDRLKMAVNYADGREAVTHYRVLENFDKFTYIECRLETGRTHQIRVHMSYIGHPLLGDTLYGPKKSAFSALTQGQTLHAGVLGFIHPRTGEYMEFEAPLPQYFKDLLLKLHK